MARTVYVPEAGGALNFADGTTDQQIVDYVRSKYAPPPAPVPTEAGIGALEAGLYGFRSRSQAGLGKAIQSIGWDDTANYLFDQSRANEKLASSYKPDIADISQIQSAGDVAKFAGSTIGQSAAETATGAAGIYTGAAAGAAVGSVVPLVGTAAGGIIGGVVGFAISSLPSFVGGNLQEQVRENNVTLEEASGYSAGIGAAAQAPLEFIFDKMIARRLPGGSAALDIAKKGFLREVAKTAGKGALVEGLTEPAQQAIQIAQANPEKLLEFGPEVQRELINAAAAGVLAGGVIGGAAGGLDSAISGKAPTETPVQKEISAGYTQAAQRGVDMRKFAEVNAGVSNLSSQNAIGTLRLNKIRIEPNPANGIKAPVDRFQILDTKGNSIAEFSDPVNATDAVAQYSKIVGKKINLQSIVTGAQVPTTAAPVVKTPQATVPIPTIIPEATALNAAGPKVVVPPKPPTQKALDKTPIAVRMQAIASDEIPYDTLTWDDNKKKAMPSSGKSKIVDYGGRKIVVADVNGVKVPFYLSSGLAGKSKVAPGKWYPFFGIGTDGWINKTSQEEIANYYGDLDLARVSQTLDSTIGDIRNDQSIPKVGMDGAHMGFINSGLDPSENNTSDTGLKVNTNIKRVLDKLQQKRPSKSEDIIGATDAVPNEGVEAVESAAPIEVAKAEPVVGVDEEVQLPVVNEEEQVRARKFIQDRKEKISDGVVEALRRYNLKDVQTKFVPAFLDAIGRPKTIEGTETISKGKSIVTLATDVFDPSLTVEQMVNKVVDVLNHESIHSLFDLGLIRPVERSVLMNSVSTAKVPGKQYTYLDFAKKVYDPSKPGFEAYTDPNMVAEEAIAEMFRDWRNRNTGAPQNTRGLFNRVIDSLRHIFNVMKRNRYEDIFTEIESGKVGLRERAPVSGQASKYSTLPSSYRKDNPGGNWLKGKQEDAVARAGKYPRGSTGKLLSGSVTAYAGHNKPLMLPVSELSKVKGASDENRIPGDYQFDELKKLVDESGYTNENPVMVFVNQLGDAYINEGNTRIAVANAKGIPHIAAWVHWYNGGESVNGNWSPQRVAQMERIDDEGKAKFSSSTAINSNEFKNWFSGSVVRNADGSPKVFYHGTDVRALIDTLGAPTFFTDNPEEASAYTFWGQANKRQKLLSKEKYKAIPGSAGVEFTRVPYVGIISDIPYEDRGKVYATDEGVVRVNENGNVDIFTGWVVDYNSGADDYNISIKRGDGSKSAEKLIRERREIIDNAYPAGIGENSRVYPVYLSIKNPIRLSALEANRLGARLGVMSKEQALAYIADLEAKGYDGIVTDSDEAKMFPAVAESLGGIPTQYIPFRPQQVKSIFNRFEEGGSKSEKLSVAPEMPELSVAPVYPYGQRVPQVNVSDTDRVISELEYGAMITRIGNILDSKFLSIVPGKYKPSDEAITDFVRKWADKIIAVGQMIDYVKQSGGTVSDAMDVYAKAQLSQSITANNLEARETDLYKPLIDFIKGNGISVGDLGRYLYALHAAERNARIRAITPKKRDENGNEIPFDPAFGSGMSDITAREIINAVERSPMASSYAQAQQMVRKIIDDTNQLRLDSGLSPDYEVNPTTIETEDGQTVTLEPYTNYVPLRGYEDESALDGDADNEFKARIGQGFKIKGREDMRAFGRTSEASNEDILAHIMLQNQEAVVRAEKNKVGLSFLSLIQSNPDILENYGVEVMTAQMKPMRKYVNSRGIVKTMVDPMYKNSDDVFIVKREGVEIPIRIKNRLLQKSLITNKSIDSGSNAKFVQFLGWLNRFVASMNTVYNPEFALVNFPRDIQQAMLNLTQYEVDGVKKKILKDALPAAYNVHKILRDPNAQNEWSGWYAQFRKDGGNTSGFYGAFSIDEQIRKIEKMSMEMNGSPTSRAKQAFESIKKMLEDYNGAFENAVRLSVYKNMVEAGASRQKAAFIAKNITVNFDQRGEYGPVMNSLYLFYNASVQGTLTLLTAASRSSKVRKALGGLIVFGFLQDLINSSMSQGEEGDEPLYDKIPDYKLENNIILMDPFGYTEKGYIAIPLAYGANAFVNLGRAMSRNIRGGYTTGEAATSMATTFIDAFNPVGGTESLLNFIVPTAMDPIVALSMNIDYSGRRIYPEAFPGSVPKANSQVYFSSTSPIFTNVADYLNRATGGSEYVPGYISVKPDALEYVYDYILGATGATARRVFDTAMNDVPKLLQGDYANIEFNNVPVLRKIYGNVSERMSFEDYFDKVNHVLLRGEELKFAMKGGDPAKVREVRAKYADELKIYPAIKALANRRNKIASELRKVRENVKMPPEQKRRRQDALQKQIEDITKRVDMLYGKQIGSKYPGLFD